MFVERVQSDEQRAFICKTAPEKLPSLLESQGLRMAPLVLADLHRDSQSFLARYKIVIDKTLHLRRLVAEKTEIMEALMVYVRHARQILEKRVVRKEINKHDLTCYGWRAGPGWGKTTSHRNWIDGAFALVKGDAYAVKEGQKPLVEPAAFEIKALADRAFQLRDRGLALETELRELETLQKPVRRELDLQIRHLKSLIIRETRHDRGIWKILLRAAGYQIRYHTQEKEPELGPDGNPVKPKKRRKLSPFQRKYKKPRNAEDKVAVLLREAHQQFAGTPKETAQTAPPPKAPETDAKPQEKRTSSFGLTQAEKEALARDAEVYMRARKQARTSGALSFEDDLPPEDVGDKQAVDESPPKEKTPPKAAAKPRSQKTVSARKPLSQAEKEKKKAKRKQEKQGRKRNR